MSLLSAEHADAPSKLFRRGLVKAQRQHMCCECREIIPKGDQYENVRGLWEGYFSTFKTCTSCFEIRDHLSDQGYIYGELWEQLGYSLFPGMDEEDPVFEGLSARSKGRILERWANWQEEHE